MAEPALRSIGQVLAKMKPDFPDITISKIRFLETEGLITPHRAPSGYRRFSEEDERRLRYILMVQREHYLPLKVIREHLDLMDRGLQPPALESIRPTVPEERKARPSNPLRLDRADLLEQSGLTEAALVELERYQIVRPNLGTRYYGREALEIATAAKQLAKYGIDMRHLRVVKNAAEREVAIIDQAVAPYAHRRGGSAEAATEMMNLIIGTHAAMVRSAIQK